MGPGPGDTPYRNLSSINFKNIKHLGNQSALFDLLTSKPSVELSRRGQGFREPNMSIPNDIQGQDISENTRK